MLTNQSGLEQSPSTTSKKSPVDVLPYGVIPKQPRRVSTSSSDVTVVNLEDGSNKCQCTVPLVFPENIKREMKREEQEHRERESKLYEKVIIIFSYLSK
jgi:hypothetical protein